MGNLYHFVGLIFTEAHLHTYYALYNQAYFAGLIFVVSRLSVKITKIGPWKNSLCMVYIMCACMNALCACVCMYIVYTLVDQLPHRNAWKSGIDPGKMYPS